MMPSAPYHAVQAGHHRVMSARAVEPATPEELDQVEDATDLRCYLRLAVLGWGAYVDSLDSRNQSDPNETAWRQVKR